MKKLPRSVYDAINQEVTPAFGRWARHNYGVGGKRLIALVYAGEGGGSIDEGTSNTSSAGARGPGQFIRSTRDAYIRQYGVDPWKNDRSAVRGTMIHLRGTGVAGYNPGMPTYQSYIMGQSVDTRPLVTGGHGRAGRGGGRTGGAVSVTQPSLSRGQVEPGGAGVSSVLAELLKQPARGSISSAGVSPPSFSAHAAMPAGFRRLPSSSVSAPDTRLSDLLGAVEGLRGAAPPKSTLTPGSVTGGRQSGGGGGSGGSGGLQARADGWYGTKTLAQAGKDVAADMGIPISSEKREKKNTATGGISDHWVGNRRAWADDYDTPGIDSATGHKLARRVAKAYGVKYVPNSYSSGGTIKVGKRTYRVQILYGSGVDHGDHVHVGLQRIL